MRSQPNYNEVALSEYSMLFKARTLLKVRFESICSKIEPTLNLCSKEKCQICALNIMFFAQQDAR